MWHFDCFSVLKAPLKKEFELTKKLEGAVDVQSNYRSYLRVLSEVWVFRWELRDELDNKMVPCGLCIKISKHILDCFLFQIICSTSFSEIVFIPTDDGCNGNGAAGAVDVMFSHQHELTSTTATTAWERRARRTQSQHCHWGGESWLLISDKCDKVYVRWIDVCVCVQRIIVY